MIKNSSDPYFGIADWAIFDNMRGIPMTGDDVGLAANTSAADANYTNFLNLSATGFNITTANAFINQSGSTYIYIAIRRGPMKTPTAGTEVFAVADRTGASGNLGAYRSGFTVDMAFHKVITSSINPYEIGSRLTQGRSMNTTDTSAEVTQSDQQYYYMDGWNTEASASATKYSWMFRRAPGFFDVVCYTGTGSNTTFNHNLGVVPELMIMKKRSAADDWAVYAGDNTDFLLLNTTAATADDNTYWNDTSPTSTVFSVGTNADVNTSAATYVAYLFASLAGISDIGTYTGNGSSVTVTTGFQPRFILVKRTDSTGNWIVGDSARGLVAADESALFLNTTGAATTGQDWVDVSATGFTVNETALNANVSTATYIYLCVS
jgi:hypothetical protein